MGQHNFKKLKVWENGINPVNDNYKLTRTFPDIEKSNRISQMNRSVISILSNIAEGSSKGTDKHFKKHLKNSLGSTFEWETQLIVSHNEGYIDENKFEALENKILQIQKMLRKFIDNLND